MDHREEALQMLAQRDHEAEMEHRRNQRRKKGELKRTADEYRSLADMKKTDGWATLESRCRKGIRDARAEMDVATDLLLFRQRQGEIVAYKAVLAHVDSAPAELERLREEVEKIPIADD
jgi:hypothetical protein